MSAKPVSHNAKDAALDELLRFNEETICRVYGVPPPVAGRLRYSTYANIQSAIELMAKTCLTPWITRLEHTINRKLLSVAERRAGVYLKFSLEGLLRGNSAERAAFYSSLISNGVLSINEARRHEELPAVPGGDQHLVNAGQAAVTTGGSTMVGAPAPAE